MAGKVIKVDPPDVSQNAQTVAAATAQAARPGPVPTAAGISPIDQAAAGVAAAVSTKVANSSAMLAPKSAEILRSSTTALSAMETQEAQNAQHLAAVAQGVHEQPAGAGDTGGSAILLGLHNIPEGRIVWCVPGPRAGPWAFHCEILYPNGTTDMYYTDEDESGGHL